MQEAGVHQAELHRAPAACTCLLHLVLRVDQVIKPLGPVLIEVLQNVVLLYCRIAIPHR